MRSGMYIFDNLSIDDMQADVRRLEAEDKAKAAAAAQAAAAAAKAAAEAQQAL